MSIIALPLYFYFIGIPWVKHFWLPMLPTWITGIQPEEEVYGP